MGRQHDRARALDAHGSKGGLAEFEREIIRARTGEGRERAKVNGVKMGRKPKMTDHQKREAIKRPAIMAGRRWPRLAAVTTCPDWTISRLADCGYAMDRLKEIISYFLAAMAMLSLLCAVYESMNQRLGSAGVLAGIFVASAFLVYLPQLETFKAFGIEARMQKNLIEAKEILEKVRQASIASAKSAYLNFAWANRWGGMSPREKQRALDSVNEQLRAVGVKDEERQVIVKPYVELIGFDLYHTFYNSVRSVLWRYRTQPTEIEGAKVISGK
jgi:hypothetical protein